MYHNLLCQTSTSGVLTITIHRPAKLNALNNDTVSELQTCVAAALADTAVRAILLTGAGERAFVAGADIAEIAGLTAATSRRFAERGQSVYQLLESSPKPVVAAVNGFALGGGCELAMACHVRVASTAARFGLPEVGLGIIPGYGGTQRLTQLVGKGKAFELILTGDHVPADEALRIGLVNHVVAPDDLLPFCQAMLSRMLAKSLVAVGQAIASINSYYDASSAGYSAEAEAFERCCASPDFQEGTQAFLQKRPARFAGQPS
ncbi:enoyl-CoA hydratase/isomerase family protein [Microvirga sp. STR05]|uniref:Enoyl-CoA hydratase/isomerase family protein n=1 Tax=Hymenobacter duratus TaxID=2771356 RepID=A0ABR8JFS2_9BACT|nr:enoyl-CoA hydratase-related protein [Hymenobacter duratus]MBD2715732.1 enoyl-CoA hydratase/isomerase family protein [Hymenobacter duratus]MBR7950643.1 enoyl-CoA hydratase/isomerase family protein [Microvirga sp. STR05]